MYVGNGKYNEREILLLVTIYNSATRSHYCDKAHFKKELRIQDLLRFLPCSSPPASIPRLKSTVTVSSSKYTTLPLCGIRIRASLITKLDTLHPLLWAASQMQFLFTFSQQWVQPMANNEWCTIHCEEFNREGKHQMRVSHNAIEAAPL